MKLKPYDQYGTDGINCVKPKQKYRVMRILRVSHNYLHFADGITTRITSGITVCETGLDDTRMYVLEYQSKLS